MRSLPLLTGLLLFSLSACVHSPPPLPGVEALKPAAETFHQRIRWRDFRGAAELLVPERRAAFLKAIAERHDERDLQINDYELEDATVLEDRTRARVVSRLYWTRLPESTVHEAVVTSEFVVRGGSWFLERQEQGPFGRELSAEYAPPADAP